MTPENKTTTCLNCQSKVVSNFCNQCGQSTKVQRITFRETLGDFFSSTFALEGQLLSTIRLLFTNPGKLFREFIEGKRKTYYKPVAFFVVLSAAYIIVRAAIDFDPLKGLSPNDNPAQSGALFAEATKYMVTHINHIMFFLVFSIGLVSKIFYYKKYNLAEYVTIAFYITGIYNLIGIVYVLLSKYFSFLPPSTQMILLLVYLIYSFISLHQKKSFSAFIKSFFASIITVIFYVIFGYGFSYLLVYFQQ